MTHMLWSHYTLLRRKCINRCTICTVSVLEKACVAFSFPATLLLLCWAMSVVVWVVDGVLQTSETVFPNPAVHVGWWVGGLQINCLSDCHVSCCLVCCCTTRACISKFVGVSLQPYVVSSRSPCLKSDWAWPCSATQHWLAPSKWCLAREQYQLANRSQTQITTNRRICMTKLKGPHWLLMIWVWIVTGCQVDWLSVLYISTFGDKIVALSVGWIWYLLCL